MKNKQAKNKRGARKMTNKEIINVIDLWGAVNVTVVYSDGTHEDIDVDSPRAKKIIDEWYKVNPPTSPQKECIPIIIEKEV